MTTEDLRALTEQGPRVVMVSSADMLRLLDELDTLRTTRRPRHVRATLLAPWLAPETA